jgi:transcriptional regulator with XRE-family HTH domain
MTQKELAARVGTTPSVISRLENDDYDGHSLAMLRRVAAALNRRVEPLRASQEYARRLRRVSTSHRAMPTSLVYP